MSNVAQLPQPTATPTRDQLGAAILAYDMELPEGTQRPSLRVHGAALEAAIAAAMKVGAR